MTHTTQSHDAPSATEKLATWMIAHGFATGHGDTLDDLLKELAWQVKAADTARARLEATDEMARALEELYGLVKGECPSLLSEDSGGDWKIDLQVTEALRTYASTKGEK